MKPDEPNFPTTVIPDHELLRRIGRGSYGEVWLARSVVGALRAVKIVWRRSFEDARPYEREFAGIQRYEPVSRGHAGLVDLLHVGRDEKAGCFFYVMELADDAVTNAPLPPASNTSRYKPKTLREIQKDRGRLPISECLDIGADIAAGLSRLHESGLVHRDIKPSNVIFVNDQPKLADIGLLASMDEAHSFVGTEGFVAPEGPGTAQADIFGFGKLLYEMATGLDRNEFPKLPPLAMDAVDGVEAFAELNEVFLRACDPDPGRRYQSAAELRRELMLLQGGRSVRQLRVLEQRVAFARKASLVLSVAAVVAIVAYFGSFRQIQRAQQAERQALKNVELLQLQKAESHFQRDDSSTAMAILAHLVRENPTNQVAAERLLAALTWRNFALPRMQPIRTEGRPQMAVFNLEDTEILTGSFDGVLQTWNAETGRLKSRKQFAKSRIYWMEYSPDGKLAAIAGDGYSAIVNASTLQPTVPLIRPSSNRVQTVHFSPNQRWMLASGWDRTARLWHVGTGEQVGPAMVHQASVRHAAFSPDNTKVVTGAGNGAVRIWAVPSGKPLTPNLWHTNIIWKVAFSPDGKLIASASDDFEARLWDATTGALRAVLRHKNCVVDVAFSPDGTKVVTSSEDLSAIIWDVATGRPIGNPLRHRNWVRQAEFSPDGERVATASEDNTTRIWDAETTEPISEPMRHPTEVLQANFNHSGKSLVATVSFSSTTGEEVWLWNVASEGARGLSFLTADCANAAGYSVDGSRIAAACEDGTVRLWNPLDHQSKEMILSHDGDGAAQHVSFSRDGRRIASVHDSNVFVWDLAESKRIGTPLTHLGRINSVQFKSDGRSILTASVDGTAAIWDAETGEQKLVLPPPHLQAAPRGTLGRDLFTASYSPNEELIVTASRAKSAIVWKADNGDRVAEFLHDHWVTHAEFSPDGRTVLTASIDRSARIWDVQTGRQIGASLTHDSDINTAHFSRNGRMVVTTSMDWTARVWDAASGKPVSDMMRHLGPVRAAAFSPDGSHVATGADDGTVRLWDTSTGLALNDGFHHSSAIRSICFSPGGESLLVVPKDGDATLYELLNPSFPAPKWLADLAEAVAGQRLDASGKLENTSPGKFFQLRASLSHSQSMEFYARWASWFLMDADKRTISPQSKVSVEDYAKRKLEANTIEGLRGVLFLTPTNAIAHARLARQLLADEAAPSSRMLSKSKWHLAQAVALAPDDPEVRAISDEMEAELKGGQTVRRADGQ